MPLASTDPRGTGLTAAMFPLVMGGMIGGIAISIAVIGALRRVLAVVVYSAVGGVFLTGILAGWFGVLMHPAAGMPFLALMFVICYVVDDRTWERAGLSEWLTVRFHATVLAVMSCLAGAAGSM